jgi:hypothetical protein
MTERIVIDASADDPSLAGSDTKGHVVMGELPAR